MAKKSNFEILAQMSKENKDIRMSTTFVSANKDSRGGVVGIGVDDKTILDLASGKEVLTILFVVDAKQYFEIAES